MSLQAGDFTQTIFTRPWILCHAPHKPDVVAHTCGPGTQEVEEGGTETQGYCELYQELKASLGSIRTCLKYLKKGCLS